MKEMISTFYSFFNLSFNEKKYTINNNLERSWGQKDNTLRNLNLNKNIRNDENR